MRSGRLDHEDRRVVGAARQRGARCAARSRRGASRRSGDADEARLLEADRIDLTLPGAAPGPGSLHPLTLVERRDRRGLHPDGLSRGRGPRDRGRLAQLPGAEHPARPSRAHDEGLALRRHPRHPELLLRTETSAAQIRTMQSQRRPSTSWLRGASTVGRPPDATHLPVFHQVEGLAVDEGISFADLKGTLETFASAHVRRRSQGAAGPRLLPVRGAGRGARRLVLHLRRRRLPHVRQRMDRAPRRGHGAPQGA